MPKLAANLSMMFNEVDFLERFKAAAEAGFKGVEFLFPYDHDKNQLADLLATHGLTQALHNMPAGGWDTGERGLGVLADRVGEFQDGVGLAIDYATTLGCKRLNCLAGVAPDGANPVALRDTLVSNLRYAAGECAKAGITVMSEPINTRDIPGFYLCHTDQALAIFDEVGADNLMLQYDIYHMQIMEGDLAPTIEANLGRIAHMQLADTPGRHEPGSGEINFGFLLSHIDAVGYDGWIGCEYKPAGTTIEGLGWTKPYLA
jgi:hydroxypyruvate isomerase